MFDGSQSLHGNSMKMIECPVLKRNFDANLIAVNTSELPLPEKKCVFFTHSAIKTIFVFILISHCVSTLVGQLKNTKF